MSYKRSFVVICTAFILVCAIPVSSSALGTLSAYDSRILKYTYNNYNIDASTSPWFHIAGSYGDSSTGTVAYERVGHLHCRGGSVDKAFVIFIPLVGYYFVVVQSNDLHSDFDIDYTTHATLTNSIYSRNGNETVQQTYQSWQGAGYLSIQNINLFQTVLFGHYVIFYAIGSVGSNNLNISRYSSDKYSSPTSSEQDAITSFIGDNSGTGDVFPGGSAAVEFLDGQKGESQTYPDGTPVPTNDNGNPAPTDQFGQPVETLNNGMPYPTYPNGERASTYVDPSGNIQTVPYTIVDNGAVQSDVNNQFDKLNSMISDLDSASSLMESNQDELSAHVDNTRDLVDGIMSWFPAPLIAVLVCGVIMIIAVKITGSGASV